MFTPEYWMLIVGFSIVGIVIGFWIMHKIDSAPYMDDDFSDRKYWEHEVPIQHIWKSETLTSHKKYDKKLRKQYIPRNVRKRC